ncbi:MAG: hypothetical protein IKU29_00605 [Parabacteroides sp.]|nr:hypothetical protein [Parabacteroides sp.]
MNNDNNNNVVMCGEIDLIDKRVNKLLDEIREKYSDNEEEMRFKIHDLVTINVVFAGICNDMSKNFDYSSEWLMFMANKTNLPTFRKHFQHGMDEDSVMVVYSPDDCMIVMGIEQTSLFIIGMDEGEISVTYLKNNIENKSLYDEAFKIIADSIHDVMFL